MNDHVDPMASDTTIADAKVRANLLLLAPPTDVDDAWRRFQRSSTVAVPLMDRGGSRRARLAAVAAAVLIIIASGAVAVRGRDDGSATVHSGSSAEVGTTPAPVAPVPPAPAGSRRRLLPTVLPHGWTVALAATSAADAPIAPPTTFINRRAELLRPASATAGGILLAVSRSTVNSGQPAPVMIRGVEGYRLDHIVVGADFTLVWAEEHGGVSYAFSAYVTGVDEASAVATLDTLVWSDEAESLLLTPAGASALGWRSVATTGPDDLFSGRESASMVFDVPHAPPVGGAPRFESSVSSSASTYLFAQLGGEPRADGRITVHDEALGALVESWPDGRSASLKAVPPADLPAARELMASLRVGDAAEAAVWERRAADRFAALPAATSVPLDGGSWEVRIHGDDLVQGACLYATSDQRLLGCVGELRAAYQPFLAGSFTVDGAWYALIASDVPLTVRSGTSVLERGTLLPTAEGQAAAWYARATVVPAGVDLVLLARVTGQTADGEPFESKQAFVR